MVHPQYPQYPQVPVVPPYPQYGPYSPPPRPKRAVWPYVVGVVALVIVLVGGAVAAFFGYRALREDPCDSVVAAATRSVTTIFSMEQGVTEEQLLGRVRDTTTVSGYRKVAPALTQTLAAFGPTAGVNAVVVRASTITCAGDTATVRTTVRSTVSGAGSSPSSTVVMRVDMGRENGRWLADEFTLESSK